MQHNDPHFEIARLLGKLIEGTLTAEEAAWLENWRQQSAANNELYNRMTDPGYLAAQLKDWEPVDQEEMKGSVLRSTAKNRHLWWNAAAASIAKGRYLWRDTTAATITKGPHRWRYAVAASILLGIAGSAYLLQRDHSLPLQVADVHADSNFMPRGNVARLLTGNGHEVALNGDTKQDFEEEDGTRVKNGHSILRYSAHAEAAAAAVYHTLMTPKGGEYTVVLSDGTTAWLNAASSLRFPSHFNGRERVVELSGEAYFEVSKDAKHPFIVKTSRSLVRVLGTAFNVNAYTDVPEERTTLASGAIRVSHGPQDRGVMLQPGFQARVLGADVQVARADMEEALAWKNGLFVFNAASLGDILHQVERWYDVDVKYESGMERRFHFTGRIHRYENITGVLELLEMTGKVRFTLNGRTLVVTPAKV